MAEHSDWTDADAFEGYRPSASGRGPLTTSRMLERASGAVFLFAEAAGFDNRVGPWDSSGDCESQVMQSSVHAGCACILDLDSRTGWRKYVTGVRASKIRSEQG